MIEPSPMSPRATNRIPSLEASIRTIMVSKEKKSGRGKNCHKSP